MASGNTSRDRHWVVAACVVRAKAKKVQYSIQEVVRDRRRKRSAIEKFFPIGIFQVVSWVIDDHKVIDRDTTNSYLVSIKRVSLNHNTLENHSLRMALHWVEVLQESIGEEAPHGDLNPCICWANTVFVIRSLARLRRVWWSETCQTICKGKAKKKSRQVAVMNQSQKKWIRKHTTAVCCIMVNSLNTIKIVQVGWHWRAFLQMWRVVFTFFARAPFHVRRPDDILWNLYCHWIIIVVTETVRSESLVSIIVTVLQYWEENFP